MKITSKHIEMFLSATKKITLLFINKIQFSSMYTSTYIKSFAFSSSIIYNPLYVVHMPHAICYATILLFSHISYTILYSSKLHFMQCTDFCIYIVRHLFKKSFLAFRFLCVITVMFAWTYVVNLYLSHTIRRNISSRNI